jgi:hypothetical protein
MDFTEGITWDDLIAGHSDTPNANALAAAEAAAPGSVTVQDVIIALANVEVVAWAAYAAGDQA